MLSVPLPTSDQPFLTQTTTLEGRSYQFTFDWNSRLDRWSFDLAIEDGAAILTGGLLCTEIDLLKTIPSTLDTAPPGQLVLVGDGDPTLDTIGNVSLIYVTSEEL